MERQPLKASDGSIITDSSGNPVFESTDPALLKLILAVMNYVDVKDSINPLVKGFSRVRQDVDVAYAHMLVCLNECQAYYPEIEEMFSNIVSEMLPEQQTEK